jgi:hypothetical protein
MPPINSSVVGLRPHAKCNLLECIVFIYPWCTMPFLPTSAFYLLLVNSGVNCSVKSQAQGCQRAQSTLHSNWKRGPLFLCSMIDYLRLRLCLCRMEKYSLCLFCWGSTRSWFLSSRWHDLSFTRCHMIYMWHQIMSSSWDKSKIRRSSFMKK